MAKRIAGSKVTEENTIRLLGGREMTMSEYAAYMQALSVKPFLTVHEASIFYNIGINKLYRIMKSPSADFAIDQGEQKYARIYRVAFEKWLLEHGTKEDQEE